MSLDLGADMLGTGGLLSDATRGDLRVTGVLGPLPRDFLTVFGML